MTAREYIGQLNSEAFSENHDRELASFATNSERMDSILYSIFPNFAPWAGFHPNITYRFRPNGDDHTTALMEVIVIKQLATGAPRPKDVPVRRLGENELFSEAPELGVSLGTIFDQDLFNMPMIQKGMHNREIARTGAGQLPRSTHPSFSPDHRQIHQRRAVVIVDRHKRGTAMSKCPADFNFFDEQGPELSL